MDRENFNKLDVKGQVTYFNEGLKQENNNFNAICKQIGISKNTILNRFKANGFEPSRAGQKIIGFSPQLGKEENIKAENSAMKNKTKANDPCQVNLILKRIELLEQKVKDLENKGLSENKNFINSYENTATKTFKIDVEVYQELEKIFDEYKMYKKQDIVSSLLKYALDNIE